MRGSFHSFLEHYTQVCDNLIAKGFQGMPMNDPFNEKRGRFDPEGLKKRLNVLAVKIDNPNE